MAEFLLGGLAAGQGALVVTSDARGDEIQAAMYELGADVKVILASGAFIPKDGAAVLERLVACAFDPSVLAVEVRPEFDAIRAVTGRSQVLGFGDMVDTL